jgi:hypothetical protein
MESFDFEISDFTIPRPFTQSGASIPSIRGDLVSFPLIDSLNQSFQRRHAEYYRNSSLNSGIADFER